MRKIFENWKTEDTLLAVFIGFVFALLFVAIFIVPTSMPTVDPRLRQLNAYIEARLDTHAKFPSAVIYCKLPLARTLWVTCDVYPNNTLKPFKLQCNSFNNYITTNSSTGFCY